MAFITWTDTYSVGVEEIDNQHKGLVKLINKLFDAMSDGQANTILSAILNDLVRYTEVHFATEEKYFALFDYPDREAHIQEHLQFVNEVERFKTQFEAGNIILSFEVFKFLRGWLVKHIQGSDKKYSTCFIANGLK
jgi:hemerythrin